MTTKLAVLVGSARSASIHRQLAEVIAGSTPAGTEVQIIDTLDTLPFYNEDLDTESVVEPVQELRRRIGDSDAVLMLSPANNGTISAVLKNAIDWASRPYGQSSLSGKPVAVASAAMNTSTVVEHTHLAVTIAGGQPITDASATFALGDLNGVDISTHEPVSTALRGTVNALVQAAARTEAA